MTVHIHNHDLRAHDKDMRVIGTAIADASCEAIECLTTNDAVLYAASLSGVIKHLRHALALAERIEEAIRPKCDAVIPFAKREYDAPAENARMLQGLFDRIRKETGVS